MNETTKTETPAETIRVVCAGLIALQSGKMGELWITEAAARTATSGEDLRERASAFAGEKVKPVVGAIYETTATIEDGRIVSIGLRRRYVEMLDTPAVQAAALASKGLAIRAASKKAEEKAAKQFVGSDAIDELARIVAAGRANDIEISVAAITHEIRKRSLAIWRASKGRTR